MEDSEAGSSEQFKYVSELQELQQLQVDKAEKKVERFRNQSEAGKKVLSLQKQEITTQKLPLEFLKEMEGEISKFRHEIVFPLVEKAKKDKEYLENQLNTNVLKGLTGSNDIKSGTRQVPSVDLNMGKANRNVQKNGIS